MSKFLLSLIAGLLLVVPTAFAQDAERARDWEVGVGPVFVIYDNPYFENAVGPKLRVSKDMDNGFTAELEASFIASEVNVFGTEVAEQKQAMFGGNIKYDLPSVYRLQPIAYAGLVAHLVDVNSHIDGLGMDGGTALGPQAGLGLEYVAQETDKLDLRLFARAGLDLSDFDLEVQPTGGSQIQFDEVDNDLVTIEFGGSMAFRWKR